MEKRMFVAVGLSMLILIAWPMIFNKKKPVNTPIQQTKTEAMTVVGNVSDNNSNNKKELKIVPSRTIVKEEIYSVENDFIKVDISSIGSKIKQVTFKKYKDDKSILLKFFGDDIETKGAIQIVGLENTPFKVISKTNQSLTWGYKGKSATVGVDYLLDNSDPYLLKSNIKVADSDKLKFKFLASISKDQSQYGFSSDPQNRNRDYLIYLQDKVERIPLKEKDKDKTVIFESRAKWVGLSDKYFLFSFIPKDNSLSEIVANKNNGDGTYSTEFNLVPKGSVYSYSLFMGPKDVSYLRKADPTLSESIDHGWFAIISVPMLELMKFFYKIIPNYGVAILLLTLLVRLLMYPLQNKSMKSMKKMQDLQPHLKILQAKYKDDKQKLNQEMMQFMKTHKVNPMSGCLPMLLQLPVFIALYNVLANAVELYRSPFIFWIVDLSAKDPLYIFPVLMGLMMFIQQKITPNPTMDPVQAKMMLFFMPIIFTVFMISLPSGLTLYIMFSTLLGITQQYAMNKKTVSN